MPDEVEILQTDLSAFQDSCNEMSTNDVFKRIGELDIKYSYNMNYIINIEGIIANIGCVKKNPHILSCALKRLLVKSDDAKLMKIFSDRINYDLGVIVSSKEEMQLSRPYNISELINTNAFKEARTYYSNVSSGSNYYLSAMTNLANDLDKYGRNHESILLYDKVLKKYPNFGMALGNKALAIDYYYRVTNKNPELLLTAIELLEKAIESPDIEKIGGPNIINQFTLKLDSLKIKVEKMGIKEFLDTHSKINFGSEEMAYYFKNDLFLNFCFGCSLCEKSIHDNLLPQFIIEASSIKKGELTNTNGIPKKVFFSFKMLNQIFEDYSVARKLLWLYENDSYSENDEITNYIYNLDYIQNSTPKGFLKASFSKLYDILNKVAHIVFYFFDIEQKDIYITSIHSNLIKSKIIECNNHFFLALYSLSDDFNGNGIYSHYRELRNKIIHEYLDLSDFDSSNNCVDIDKFYEDTLSLFGIVKSALIYYINAIEFEGSKYDNNKLQQRSVYFQRDFF